MSLRNAVHLLPILVLLLGGCSEAREEERRALVEALANQPIPFSEIELRFSQQILEHVSLENLRDFTRWQSEGVSEDYPESLSLAFLFGRNPNIQLRKDLSPTINSSCSAPTHNFQTLYAEVLDGFDASRLSPRSVAYVGPGRASGSEVYLCRECWRSADVLMLARSQEITPPSTGIPVSLDRRRFAIELSPCAMLRVQYTNHSGTLNDAPDILDEVHDLLELIIPSLSEEYRL